MDNLVQQGIDLALYGMGTVFIFLTLLVLATSVMSRIVLAFEPVTDAPIGAGSSITDVSHDPALIAAITVAIQQYRSDRQ
jgi:oxaloacetate decarboxylase gamma subunit